MNRGQMILAAGALIVIALIATLLAILQLGYQPAGPSTDHSTPPDETRRVIEEALIEAEPVARDYAWINRSVAAGEVRVIVSERLNTLNQSDSPAVRRVEFAPEVAADDLSDTCPRGPGRHFGPCAAIDGIVLQDRGDTTHLVGVVLRITVTHETGNATMTILVRPLLRVVDGPDSDEEESDKRNTVVLTRSGVEMDWLAEPPRSSPLWLPQDAGRGRQRPR